MYTRDEVTWWKERIRKSRVSEWSVGKKFRLKALSLHLGSQFASRVPLPNGLGMSLTFLWQW